MSIKINKQLQRLVIQNRGCFFANSKLPNRSCIPLTVRHLSDHSQNKTFQELLDESPIMKFGRPDNKCLVGKITDVCNDDLYIDFGGKFEAVLKKPEERANFYKQGALVRILLRKFEMTGAFLGDPRHITLCEADALLVGPYSKQFEQRRKKDKK